MGRLFTARGNSQQLPQATPVAVPQIAVAIVPLSAQEPQALRSTLSCSPALLYLSSQLSILSSQFSVLSSQLSVLNSQFSILKFQFSNHETLHHRQQIRNLRFLPIQILSSQCEKAPKTFWKAFSFIVFRPGSPQNSKLFLPFS